jgi:hypothetical protein
LLKATTACGAKQTKVEIRTFSKTLVQCIDLREHVLETGVSGFSTFSSTGKDIIGDKKLLVTIIEIIASIFRKITSPFPSISCNDIFRMAPPVINLFVNPMNTIYSYISFINPV